MTSVGGQRSGFSLVEILTVISIISLLSAILFPVFNRARENGRRAACQSNLRQMGLAFSQYAHDYDDRLPLRGFGYQMRVTSGASGMATWDYVLMPYVKNSQVFLCPSDTTSRVDLSTLIGYGGMGKRSYAYANYIGNIPGGRHLTHVPLPALTVLAADRDSTAVSVATWHWSYDANSTGSTTPRHLGATNFLFADGHVKAYPTENGDGGTIDLPGHPKHNPVSGTLIGGSSNPNVDLPAGL